MLSLTGLRLKRPRLALALLIGGLYASQALATANVACVASAGDLTLALAALSTAPGDTNADEIRIRVGTYVAPVSGWIGTVINHHDLTIRGGYVDALCTQQARDASLTVLDGNNVSGILTINATAIPASNVEISGLTFQNGNGSSPFQSAAGALKVGDSNAIFGGTILIERNIFRHNSAVTGIPGTSSVGALLAATDGNGLVVRDNLFVDNSSPNVPAALIVSDNAIDLSNNTFTANHATDALQQRVIVDYFTPTGLSLDNNIFWGNSTGVGISDIDVSGTFRHAHLDSNDIETLIGTPASTTNALHVDPDFRGNGDFRLAPFSSLIDAGTNVPSGGTGLVDLDGADRLDGLAIDVGAYETNYLFVDGFD